MASNRRYGVLATLIGVALAYLAIRSGDGGGETAPAPDGGSGGSSADWWASFPEQPGEARQEYILAGWRNGAFDPIQWRTVQLAGTGALDGYYAWVEVPTDGLSVDGERVQMTPRTLVTIAKEAGGALMTPHVSDAAWRAADVKNEPMTGELLWGKATPWYADETMRLGARYRQYNTALNNNLAGLGAKATDLIGNPGKDWVLTAANWADGVNGIGLAFVKAAANYGWFRASGVPVQPVGLEHIPDYDDYSQIGRFMRRYVRVRNPSGEVSSWRVADLLVHPELAGLLTGSDGPLPAAVPPWF